MDFRNVASLTIPEGEVYSISAGGVLLWQKQGGGPTPGVLPPNTEIWYKSTAKISSPGTAISNEWNSATGEGVLTFSQDLTQIGYGWLGSQTSLLKLYLPDSVTYIGNAIKGCTNLQELYAGSGLEGFHEDALQSCNSLVKIALINNSYFEANETGLVSTAQNSRHTAGTLVKGTVNLDILNTGCTLIGKRCLVDVDLTGKTLKFASTITAFVGDWNIGKAGSSACTMYWYPTVAPTLSQNQGNIRCGAGTTVHIPVGSLSSYQTKWANLNSFANMTFIEDL